MSGMDSREKNVAEAANLVFLRYGVKRASMGDIAQEAGVARQTLYNIYANKDDVLRGTLQYFRETTEAAMDATLPGLATLDAKLAFVFEETVAKPFLVLHSSPNADDLVAGYNDTGRAEMEATAHAVRVRLTSIFEPHEAALAQHGLTPAIAAECLQKASKAYKYDAHDEAHLRALLDGLIKFALSSVAD
ncbi:MAG: TetR/AcrR family transcriptional regulator [Pseudomonadota bacterium]